MNWGMMEILSPSAYSYLSSSPANWLITSGAENNHSTGTTKWTQAENKAFENALALYDNLEAPDRWEKVAAAIPGKTVKDVIRQYKELELDVSNIEAGFADIEVDDGGGGSGVVDFYNGYGGGNSAGFTLEWVNGNGGGYGYKLQNGGRRGPSGSRGTTDHERKKGIPWTEEEHKLFLMGLKKYGKGDWRNISRNFVVTRTPTQVASHAQKYFIRQLSGGKDKRRASIHDITTSTLDNETLTTTTTSSCSPPENHHHQHNSSTAFLHHHRQQPMMMMAAPTGTAFPWNQQQQQGNGVDFNSIMRGGGNCYVSLPYGGVNYSSNTNSNNPYAVKIEPGQQHNGGFNSLGAYNHQQMQTPLHHFTH